jgi:hypothetical protein
MKLSLRLLCVFSVSCGKTGAQFHRRASLLIQVHADNRLKLTLNKSGRVVYPR